MQETAEMTVYEFGVVSSVHTLEAPSDRIADAAMLVALNTDAPVVVYAPERRVLPSALDGNVVDALNAHFGGDFRAFFTAHGEAIMAAANTVQEGKIADRTEAPAHA